MTRVRKFRGSKTHGKGTHKNRRGGGSRGGRGKCGGCKHHFGLYGINWGKHGFVSVSRTEKKAINIGELDKLADKLLAEGKAELKEDSVHIDLTNLGIDKILGGGKVRKKFVLTVGEVSGGAKQKLESAGCKILTTSHG